MKVKKKYIPPMSDVVKLETESIMIFGSFDNDLLWNELWGDELSGG